MTKFWQQFINAFGEPEIACAAILVLIGVPIGSIALVVYLATIHQYLAAISVVMAIGVLAGVCIRDYRRGQPSFLSKMVLFVLLLVAGAVTIYAVQFAGIK